jgi:hypothetical protein
MRYFFIEAWPYELIHTYVPAALLLLFPILYIARRRWPYKTVLNLSILQVLLSLPYVVSFVSHLFSMGFFLFRLITLTDFPLVLGVISFVAGIYSIDVGLRGVILKRETIVDQWNVIVENAAGRGKQIMETTQKFLWDANMPGVILKVEPVSTILFGPAREAIVIRHFMFKDHKMYIMVRDFGVNLDASWYITIEPRFFKRIISKRALGSPHALSQSMDVFSMQDISALKTVADNCFRRALRLVVEELERDPSVLDTRSRGYLSVW